MAATEVIHFPLCVQLDREAAFPANAIRGSTVSPPASPPNLLGVSQARPDGIPLSSATGGPCE